MGVGGGLLPYEYMHIRYVPRESPPFSAQNFRSGASPFYIFCHSGDHHFQNFFTFKPGGGLITTHGQLTAASPGVSGSGNPHFLARACSGALHFHAWARSRAPHFSFCRGTHLPKFGVSAPPPPPTRVWVTSTSLENTIYRHNTGISAKLNTMTDIYFKSSSLENWIQKLYQKENTLCMQSAAQRVCSTPGGGGGTHV